MVEKILVLGATGKTGSRVSKKLRERGVPHRAVSRGSDPSFDWYARDTWTRALDEITTAYVTFIPDLAVPGAPEIIDAFVTDARGAGVERLVLLSERRQADAARCEEILRSSPLEWTILQASWFMENFSEGGFHHGIESNLLRVPVKGTREPFVALDDLAEVAVAALVEDGHVGETYEVTGPELLSFETVVHRIGEAIGRPVRFEPCTSAEFQETLVAVGVEPRDASFVAGLVESILDGRNENLGDGVERALGRSPTTFSTFLKEALENNAWTLGGKANEQ